jgi:hypothetical protein
MSSWYEDYQYFDSLLIPTIPDERTVECYLPTICHSSQQMAEQIGCTPLEYQTVFAGFPYDDEMIIDQIRKIFLVMKLKGTPVLRDLSRRVDRATEELKRYNDNRDHLISRKETIEQKKSKGLTDNRKKLKDGYNQLVSYLNSKTMGKLTEYETQCVKTLAYRINFKVYKRQIKIPVDYPNFKTMRNLHKDILHAIEKERYDQIYHDCKFLSTAQLKKIATKSTLHATAVGEIMYRKKIEIKLSKHHQKLEKKVK